MIGWPEWEQEVYVRLVACLDKGDTLTAATYLHILLRFLRDGKFDRTAGRILGPLPCHKEPRL
jgi:hypothetical protein